VEGEEGTGEKKKGRGRGIGEGEGREEGEERRWEWLPPLEWRSGYAPGFLSSDRTGFELQL